MDIKVRQVYTGISSGWSDCIIMAKPCSICTIMTNLTRLSTAAKRNDISKQGLYTSTDYLIIRNYCKTAKAYCNQHSLNQRLS